MSGKPSQQEEEYFARQEVARGKQDQAAHESRAAETERLRGLAAAKDRCPNCATPLVGVQYRRVEVNTCTSCRGV